MDRVQRQATKMMGGLKVLRYEEKPKKLNLFTLEETPAEDVITKFKILRGEGDCGVRRKPYQSKVVYMYQWPP